MGIVVDRRALLVGATAVPLAVATAATAPDLEATFAEWKQAIWAINHTPGLSDEAAEALGDRAGRAEQAILRAPDASPRLAAMRLWLGLEFALTGAADTDAVTTEDLAALLSRFDGYDWDVQCTIRALQALVASSGKA